MRAFVTGSTGFIGRHLIRELLAHGYEVNALVRTMDRARTLPPGLRVTAGDVTKPESMRAGMDGAEVVFHLAASHGAAARPKDRERLERINVEGTRQVLELAAALAVPKSVHVSSVVVFGHNPGQTVDESFRPQHNTFHTEFERTKYLAHFEVAAPMQARGAPVVIVCLGQVYGPGDTSRLKTLLRLYARRRLPVMLGPETALTWVHVQDVAAGLRLAAEQGRPGETYILAGPAHTYREFFAAAQRATGLPAPRVWLSAGVASLLAGVLASIRPGAAEAMRSLAGVSYVARADKARQALGWNPRSVEAGLPETLAWLSSED